MFYVSVLLIQSSPSSLAYFVNPHGSLLVCSSRYRCTDEVGVSRCLDFEKIETDAKDAERARLRESKVAPLAA